MGRWPRLPSHIPHCIEVLLLTHIQQLLGKPLWPNGGRGKNLGQTHRQAGIKSVCHLPVDLLSAAASFSDDSEGRWWGESLPCAELWAAHLAGHFLWGKLIKGILVNSKWLSCVAKGRPCTSLWHRRKGMLGKENVHVIYGVFVLFHDRGGSQQPGGQYDSSHAYQPGPFSTTPMPGSTVRCQETWSCDTLWVTLGSSGH